MLYLLKELVRAIVIFTIGLPIFLLFIFLILMAVLQSG